MALYFGAVAPLAAEEAEQSVPSEHEAAAAAPAHKPSAPPAESIGGFFFGRVLSVDPKNRFIYLRSVDAPSVRKLFYLDKKTQFREKKKRIRPSVFKPGDQAAVRFFARGELALADALYLVKGEFNMKDYRVVRKAAEGGGEAAGGHGAKPAAAEKPAAHAKPKGGGH